MKKKCQKNEVDWTEIVDVEMEKIGEKERILNDLTFNQIMQTNLSHKVKAHNLAANYLKKLIPNTSNALKGRGFYQQTELDQF